MLRRVGVRRESWALYLAILMVLALFGLAFWLLSVEFGRQISQFLTNLPQALGRLEHALQQFAVGKRSSLRFMRRQVVPRSRSCSAG